MLSEKIFRLNFQQQRRQIRNTKKKKGTHDIHLLLLYLLVHLDDPHQREPCNTKRISIVLKSSQALSLRRHTASFLLSPPPPRGSQTFVLNYSVAAGVADTLIRG